jgi:hypothetical protein
VKSDNPEDFLKAIRSGESFTDLSKLPQDEYCIVKPPTRRPTLSQIVSILEPMRSPTTNYWTRAHDLHRTALQQANDPQITPVTLENLRCKAFDALKCCANLTDDWRAWYYLATYIRNDFVSWKQLEDGNNIASGHTPPGLDALGE